MVIAHIVISVPMPDEATEEDAQNILNSVSQHGFTTELEQAQRYMKPYAKEAGASIISLYDAVLNGRNAGRETEPIEQWVDIHDQTDPYTAEEVADHPDYKLIDGRWHARERKR